MSVTLVYILGIYLSEDLKPSLQCVEAAKKASSALGIIKELFPHLKYLVLPCYTDVIWNVFWHSCHIMQQSFVTTVPPGRKGGDYDFSAFSVLL